MRKALYGLVIIGLLFGGIAQQVEAQGKIVEFNLNINALTDDYFRNFVFGVGAGLDFSLGKNVMISPDVLLISDFSESLLISGATLNIRLKRFFLGGGIVVPLGRTGGFESGELWLKVNVGYRIKKIKFALYMISPFEDFLQNVALGGSIGYVF